MIHILELQAPPPPPPPSVVAVEHIATAVKAAEAIQVYKLESGSYVLDNTFALHSPLPETPFSGIDVKISPDGNYMAYTLSFNTIDENMLVVVDTSDWSTVFTDIVTDYSPTVVEWNHDSTMLVTVGNSLLGDAITPPIRVYNVAGWTTRTEYGSGEGYGVAFNHDSTLLAFVHYPYGTGKVCSIYDISDNWSLITNGPTMTQSATDVTFNNDGTQMAISHYGGSRVTVYDTSTWSSVPSPVPTITPLNGNGRNVDYSPNGSYLALRHSSNATLTIFETNLWTRISGVSMPQSSYALDFNTAGDKLVIAPSTSNYIRIYDVPSFTINQEIALSTPAPSLATAYLGISIANINKPI